MSCPITVTKQNIDVCKTQFDNIKPENVLSTGNETLDAARKCAKTVEKNNKLGECNSLITTYNNQQSCLLTKAQDNWQTEKTKRENSQRDWDNRRNDIFNGNQETKATNNGGCIAYDWWCRNDFGDNWEDDGQIDHWGCEKKRRCRKTNDYRWRQADEQIKNERGNRPGDYNISRPTQDAFPFYQQVIGADVQCCTNYFDCGNNCTALNNKQSCLQAINSTIEEAANPTLPNNPSATAISATSTTNRFENENYRKAIITFLLLFCLCLLFTSSVSAVL